MLPNSQIINSCNSTSYALTRESVDLPKENILIEKAKDLYAFCYFKLDEILIKCKLRKVVKADYYAID